MARFISGSCMNMSEEKACLCAACQRKLIKYNKAIEQVTKLSSEIISKINVPTSASQAESSHSRPHTGEKRSAVAAPVENDELLTSLKIQMISLWIPLQHAQYFCQKYPF